MRALRAADERPLPAARQVAQQVVHPGARGVDDQRRAQRIGSATPQIADGHAGHAPGLDVHALGARPGAHVGAGLVCGENVLDHEALGKRRLGIVVARGAAQVTRLQQRQRGHGLRCGQHPVTRQRFARGQEIVEPHAGCDRQRPAASAAVDRDHQGQRPHQVRGDAQQGLTLVQRLTDQPELGELQIAQSAVYQPARPARGGAAEIRLLHEAHTQPPARRVPRDAGAVDAAADDDEIICHRLFRG